MSLVDVNSSISYEVTDHLAGTSYHKVQISNKKKDMKITSWISYWKHHTGLPLPRCCPGNSVDVNKPAGEQQVAHELHSVVGAHVRIKDTEGNVRFGIVPACKTCNNWEVRKEIRLHTSSQTTENLTYPPFFTERIPASLAVQGRHTCEQQQV